MNLTSIRALFVVSAVYDFLIGLAFLAAGPDLLERFSVPAPNHWGYIHFSCLLLMIFGVLFLQIAWKPIANRGLIPFGILLKGAYVSVTGFYAINGGIPFVFLVFLVADAVMLLLFVWAWWWLGRPSNTGKAEH